MCKLRQEIFEMDEFRLSRPSWRTIKFNRKYSLMDGCFDCLNCDGTGRAYRIEDNDCIEGYKMADKKPCQQCKGTGRVSEWPVYVKYAEDCKVFNHRVVIHNKEVDMLKAIKLKLSKAEFQYLGLGKIQKRMKPCVTSSL